MDPHGSPLFGGDREYRYQIDPQTLAWSGPSGGVYVHGNHQRYANVEHLGRLSEVAGIIRKNPQGLETQYLP